MKQVFFTKEGVQVQEVPAPVNQPGFVLVQVTHSVISPGTESTGAKNASGGLRALLKKPGAVKKIMSVASQQGVMNTLRMGRQYFNKLVPTGYSVAGIVVDGGDTGFARGDLVACAGAGYANHADIVSVPKNLVAAVPDGVDMTHAAFATIGAIAIQGIRRAAPQLGETVVVAGLGLIGQLSLQILSAMGCRAIGIDLDDSRIQLARNLGCKSLFNLAKCDVVQEIKAATEGWGADSAIICAATSSSEPINQAFEYVRRKGRVVLVGAVGMSLERDELYKKEQDFLISCSYGPGRYDVNYEEKGFAYPIEYVRWTENRNIREFLRLVQEGKLCFDGIINSTYPIDEAQSAYADIMKGKALGVVLEYPVKADQVRKLTLECKVKPRDKGASVAVIGAGTIAQVTHLPSLAKLSKCQIHTVVDVQPHVAKNIGKHYNAKCIATDYKEALADPEIDAVFVITRHDSHHQITLDAIKAGKHVFVEKPLALTVSQCEEICAEAQKAGVLVAVGFNRRLAPLAVKAKAFADSKPGPKNIIYRINAGALPKDHWTLDPEVGGGRIIGEACHFFDFNAWLIGSPIVKVAAAAAREQGEIQPDDVTVSFGHADGSTSAVIYTSLGASALPKELVEFHAAGSSLVMDDFLSLSTYGSSVNKESRKSRDKGHSALIANFVEAVQGESELMVTAADGLAAAVVAEKVMEMLNEGGKA